MIVDTSVLYDSLVSTPFGEVARRLLTSSLVLRAPDLIQVELAGALTKAVRRKDLTIDQAKAMFARINWIMPGLDATSPLIERAFALSVELTHPVADCIFLAHAEARGDVLITSDGRFARKVAASPHARHILALPDWASGAA